jgi:hypothetical protein
VLSRATGRSLVLLDEFGKGTLTSDGVGLLAGVLRHYAAQPSPPLLLACTHFSELLAPGVWVGGAVSMTHCCVCNATAQDGGARHTATAAALPAPCPSCNAGILPRSPHLQLCTMQVLVGGAGSSASAAAAAVNDEQQQPDEGAVADWEREHVFLYKLAPGVVASSYGVRGAAPRHERPCLGCLTCPCAPRCRMLPLPAAVRTAVRRGPLRDHQGS